MNRTARVTLLAFAVAAAVSAASAQDLNLGSKTKFAEFNLALAPTLTGSLDGRADLTLNWTDWLQTLAGVSALNSQDSTSGSSGDSTRLTTTLSGSVEALRINQNLLWKILPFKLRWLEFHAGALARLVDIEEKRFGMTLGPTAFYDLHSSTKYIKPMVSVGGGLNFGLVKLEGSYEVSPLAVKESLSGTSVESNGGAFTTTPFTGDDIGLETRITGEASLDFRALGLYGNAEYFRHLGYNKFVSGGTASPYAYSTVDLLVGGGVKLNFVKISGVSPYFGATWIQRDFEPLASLPGGQVPAINSHWRLDFGFGL
jgi:hypothetical protein